MYRINRQTYARANQRRVDKLFYHRCGGGNEDTDTDTDAGINHNVIKSIDKNNIRTDQLKLYRPAA